MCGISGFCDFSLNYYDKKNFWETILVQMHETLKHRGPDQAMIDLQPHVGLSHARPVSYTHLTLPTKRIV